MRFIAYLLILLHGITQLPQPIGSTTAMNFGELYRQCSLEDHDITPLDFVFEHLLNFEYIINFFEGEEEAEHHPFQTIESSTQLAVTLPAAVSISWSKQPCFAGRARYVVLNTGFHSSSFYADIFRPPTDLC